MLDDGIDASAAARCCAAAWLWGGVVFWAGAATLVERLTRAVAAMAARSATCSASSRCTATARARRRSATFSAAPVSTLACSLISRRCNRDRLITPSDGGLRPNRRARGSHSLRPSWTIATHGFQIGRAARPSRALARARTPHGRAPDRVLGQRRPRQLWTDERRRVGWRARSSTFVERLGCAAAARRGRRERSRRHAALVASSSAAGASWVFPLDALRARGAFLAVRMNGAPLTPITARRSVSSCPAGMAAAGSSGSTAIRVVGADEPTTSQMVEFSLRTHQGGIPKLARDYARAGRSISPRRRFASRNAASTASIEYRVVGIVWGGDRPGRSPGDPIQRRRPAQAVHTLPGPAQRTAPGRSGTTGGGRRRPASTASPCARPTPPSRTRRLDVSFYVRRVVIDAKSDHDLFLVPGYAGSPAYVPYLSYVRLDLKPHPCGCHCTPSAMMRSSRCAYDIFARFADCAKSSSSASCGLALASIT